MSETALRNVNAVLLSERRSNSKKQGHMKVDNVAIGANDENQDSRARIGHGRLQQHPPVAAKPKNSSIVQVEAPAEPLQQDIEYILSEDLTPLLEPDVQLSTLLTRLDSREWLTVLEALNDARKFAVFQPDSLVHILNSLVSFVITAMKNPRSALCKTALMATTDLFKAYQDRMLDGLDPLLLQLLLKATQDKKFVCEEAERALVGMTSWISPTPCLEKLRPYASHRNPRVRAKTATCFYRSVSRLGVDGITGYGLEPLIRIAATQLNDQLPEARDAARKLLTDLHAVHSQCTGIISNSEHSAAEAASDEGSGERVSWEEFCLRSLTPLTAQAVLRVTSPGK